MFPTIPLDQQQILLTLAAKQGFLHARQLPSANGQTDRARHFFAPLLAGQVEALPAIHPVPFDPVDQDLDEAQLAAVARALHTPDVALIVGLPGTGKSRTVAELIRQATRRGQRVLFCSPLPAGIDAVLARLDGDSHALPLRGLSRDEIGESLPPVCEKMTFAAYTDRLGPQAVAHAQRSAADFAAVVMNLGQADAALSRLAELAERRGEIAARIAELEAASKQQPLEMRRLADAPDSEGPLVDKLHEQGRAFVAELERFTADKGQAEAACQRLEGEAAELASRLAELQGLASARHHWKVLSGQFWKSLKSGDVAGQIAEVQARLNAARAARAEEAAKRDLFEQQTRQIELNWQAERGRLIEQEIARRQAGYADQKAALLREDGELDDKCQQIGRDLGGLALPVGADLSAARTAVQQQLTEAQRDGALARRWIECLQENLACLPARLLESVNVAAATPAGLNSDEQLGELIRRGPFDLLILDDAHRLGEADLFSLSRLAERRVLVGEPLPDASSEPERADSRSSNRGHGSGRSGTATLARPRPKTVSARAGVLPRLWQQLHCDIWRSETGRVVCQLRPLTPADRAHLECESVADCPEVELHIFAPAVGEPTLSEVLFPAALSIEQAKLFLYRELNELPIPAAAASWEESLPAGRTGCARPGHQGPSNWNRGYTSRSANAAPAGRRSSLNSIVRPGRATGPNPGLASTCASTMPVAQPASMCRTARAGVGELRFRPLLRRGVRNARIRPDTI